MPTTPIRTAMVLAAGLGRRMLPLTLERPKVLVEVFGKPLLDHVLDGLAAAGVETAVVNVHHFADMVERHLAGRGSPRVIVSDEREELLDSGGGIVKALPHLGKGPFFLRNADSFWIEGLRPNLTRLAEAFDEREMDALLLLAVMTSSVGFEGRGDFAMDSLGRLRRRGEREITPFAYAGAAVLAPRLFEGAPSGPFSLNRLFDRAIERERLFGLRLEGVWMHVGTPEAIAEAEASIAQSTA